MEDHKVLQGYLNLTAEVIKTCFQPLTLNQSRYLEREKRIKFASDDNKLIDLFCDCSDNFEASKLRSEIINYANNL